MLHSTLVLHGLLLLDLFNHRELLAEFERLKGWLAEAGGPLVLQKQHFALLVVMGRGAREGHRLAVNRHAYLLHLARVLRHHLALLPFVYEIPLRADNFATVRSA